MIYSTSSVKTTFSEYIICSLLKDTNECEAGTFSCNPNAICLDTIGSYMCMCRDGYEGDGIDCMSKLVHRGIQIRMDCNKDGWFLRYQRM